MRIKKILQLSSFIFILGLPTILFAEVTSIGVESDESSEMTDYRDGASELEVYRFILNKRLASYQDVADLLVMEAGEFSSYRTKAARLERANEYEFLDFDSIEEPSLTAISRGAVAKAVMNNFKLPKGFLFWVTSFERYAFRDLQQFGIVGFTVSPYSDISGSQLIGNFNIARKKFQEKENWGNSGSKQENEEDEE